MTASGFHECDNCGEKFVGKINARYCCAPCRREAWRKRQRAAKLSRGRPAAVPAAPFVPRSPVPMFVRSPLSSWEDDLASVVRTRIVVASVDVDCFEALPVPVVDDLGEGDAVYLDGQTVEVVNLADRSRWLLRLAQCGQGPCCCDVQGWPVDYDGPIPPAEVYDAASFYATSVKEFRRLRRLEVAR